MPVDRLPVLPEFEKVLLPGVSRDRVTFNVVGVHVSVADSWLTPYKIVVVGTTFAPAPTTPLEAGGVCVTRGGATSTEASIAPDGPTVTGMVGVRPTLASN